MLDNIHLFRQVEGIYYASNIRTLLVTGRYWCHQEMSLPTGKQILTCSAEGFDMVCQLDFLVSPRMLLIGDLATAMQSNVMSTWLHSSSFEIVI